MLEMGRYIEIIARYIGDTDIIDIVSHRRF